MSDIDLLKSIQNTGKLTKSQLDNLKNLILKEVNSSCLENLGSINLVRIQGILIGQCPIDLKTFQFAQQFKNLEQIEQINELILQKLKNESISLVQPIDQISEEKIHETTIEKEDPNLIIIQSNKTEFPSENNFKSIYAQIKNFSENHKIDFLPPLRKRAEYNKDSLTLILLYFNKGKAVLKSELTEFIRIYVKEVNDVQQARHLSAQKGWPILSGSRGDRSPSGITLKKGQYLFEENLQNPIKLDHRLGKLNVQSFDELKEKFSHLCSTCKAKEGEFHYEYPNSIVKLQQGHMDPTKELTIENCIPQCQFCNQIYKDKYAFDGFGKVTKSSSWKVIEDLPEEEQLKVYEMLKGKFK